MLTVLGILLGFFVILNTNPNRTIISSFVIITSLATSISMLISGVSGSYLTERAEQKRDEKELKRAMGIIEDAEEETLIDNDDSEEEIQKAMIIPVRTNYHKTKRKASFKIKKKEKTLLEKAERFAGIIVAIVNGVSPFLGGIVAIIPFFFVKEAGTITFLISFAIIFVCIIFLGAFLGVISEESILKNILQMLGAFSLTVIITVLFLG